MNHSTHKNLLRRGSQTTLGVSAESIGISQLKPDKHIGIGPNMLRGDKKGYAWQQVNEEFLTIKNKLE